MLLTNFRGISPRGSRFRHVDDFFNDRYRRLINESQIEDDDLTLPAVNVEESKENYEVKIAAPGYNKEDFNVTIDNGVLNISAIHEGKIKTNNKTFTRREFNYSSFQRSFSLPEEVDDENISANYQNGILTISLPRQAKPEENETIKKISIS